MLSPWISITTQPQAATDHTGLYTVLIVQVVTIAVFAAGLIETRRRDRLNREAEDARDRRALLDDQEKERETLRLNMKREVFLEVAPAIQKNYIALARFVDFQTPFASLLVEMRETLESSAGAIARLQAVAGNETLEAARQVQTLLGRACLRLIMARANLGQQNDVAAVRQMAIIWKQEAVAFPPLLAALIGHARKELHLPFDRAQFEAGVVDSNAMLFAELEKMTGPL